MSHNEEIPTKDVDEDKISPGQKIPSVKKTTDIVQQTVFNIRYISLI